MTDENDFIRVIEEGDPSPVPVPTWKVAVIDDDPAVHEGTRFALYDYSLNGNGIEILSAHSAAEGRQLMRSDPNIAVILLDVVMETDDAGLRLVDYIRTQLKNETVRIILRTGQPGQAPERRVIVDYDINDYKAKTELTADKLFTALTAALRGYQQLQRMVETRRGLEMIIEGASTLFDFKSMQRLAEGVLTQLATLINAECGGILVLRDSASAIEQFSILAGSGCYRRFSGTTDATGLDPTLLEAVTNAFQRHAHEFQPNLSVLYIRTASAREVVVLLETQRPLSATDRSLVEVFCSRLSVAFDNVILYEQLNDATVRLEERVRERTRALTAANHRMTSQWMRLRRANEFKNEVLSTVAHDLKNPLAVILGRAEMLNELAELNPIPLDKIREQLAHIRSSATQLTGMVNDLVADAMMDALDISIRQEPVDLAAVLAEVVTTNRGLAERKRQTIHLISPPVRWSNCDPDRLREAVDNLLSNAIKYSPTGGNIELMMTADGTSTTIRVRDEGAGLSQEDIGRLFGRFQRLSAKPTAGETSTGLGLSIVKRIVELHGGTVSAESPGPGAERHSSSNCRRHRARHDPQSAHLRGGRRSAGARDGRRLFEAARLRRHAVRRRQEPARRHRETGSGPDHPRPQHAGGGRAFDHPRAQAARRRSHHHAHRHRQPDRPGGGTGTRRRRLSGETVRAARAAGARPLGAAKERRGAGGRSFRGQRESPIRFGTKWLDINAQVLRDEDGNEHPLVSSEFQLLKAFAENPKRVLSREKLLDLAEARDREAFDRAIDVRITRIRRKIEPDPAHPTVIRTVRGSGYLFSPDGSDTA